MASECISILSKGLTLLWYPEWLRVSWQDLMHDPAELIEHLQALLLPHTGVVEARESWLEREHKVMQHCQETNVASRGCQLVRLLYFSAGKQFLKNYWNKHYTCKTDFSSVTFWVWKSWLITLVASVRMSFESFTRHCSGTVTSMTFALSCFLLLSVTNLPYQALRIMRPV